MKPYIKVGLFVTGAFAILAFLMSVSLVRNLLQKVPLNETESAPSYHFSLYIPDAKNAYFSDIVAGARRAASDYRAALSVHTIEKNGVGLRMASWIGADGIAVCPGLDDDVVKEKLERLRADGIPLVLVNHNIPATQPWPFIGTNNFDLGKKVGSLILGEYSSGVHLAVIYSDKTPAMYAERELVEMGIRAASGEKLLGSVTTLKTDSNPRAAEQVVYQLARSQDNLTLIVFTDTEDTLAGTQALVDLNLVGRIGIVGFGADPAILAFIKKGIISGTLIVNPELIGYQAISSLAELCDSGYTSNSVDTGIDLVTRANLDYFMALGKRDRP